MNALLVLPILLPLLGAAVSILAGRSRTAQRVISITVLSTVIGLSIALLVKVDQDGIVAVQAGGWPAPLGITLVADRFSALMLCVASVMLLAVLVYAIGQPGAERNHVGFQSVYLVLAAGVAASFLTGRPVQPVRGLRDDADVELRADDPRRPRRPGAHRHDLRRDQPRGVDALPRPRWR